MLRRIPLVFAVLWSLCGFCATPVWADPALDAVTIMTPAGPVVFSCEVMRTEEERERGLMFRPYLPQMRGMLFDFGETRPVQMWMKDTPIPLDMIFIRADGTIARVAENAEPFSERVIPSGGPIRAVLEINGGLAAKFGITAGERVNHALFQP
jgi:hypothetical protein